jgi:hypothetical protein
VQAHSRGTLQVLAQYNGDGAGNYDYQVLDGSGAAVVAAEAFGSTGGAIGHVPASTATANVFGPVVVDIPHYANALNNKCGVSKATMKRGTTANTLNVRRYAHFWRSIAAVTQVTLVPLAGNFLAGSTVTLQGWP